MLNPEQSKASAHGDGNALVLAGPGTGKTRTLVERFRHLVEERGVSPDAIMVATFTTKAAQELKDRVRQETGLGEGDGLWIGTFHSLCMRVLRRFAPSAGLDRKFEMLDDRAQRELLSEDLGVEWNDEDGDLAEIIARWKDDLVGPEAAEKWSTEKGLKVYAAAARHYAAYQRELKRRGACDFADLILKTIGAMRRDPRLKAWFADFEHLLVDEFQDVNKLQVRFIELLGGEVDLWAVSDDDQAIYGWRGGRVSYTLRFRERFGDASVYRLQRNYRCPPIVVAGAGSVISNNRRRHRKTLEAHRAADPQRDVVSVKGFESESEEAVWIAEAIQRMVSKGQDPRGVAVLFRSAAATPSLQKALSVRRVPFELRGAQNFWTLPEVKLVIETLRMLHKPPLLREFRGTGKRGYAIRDLVKTMKGSTIGECAEAVGRTVGQHPPEGVEAERKGQWTDAAESVAQEAKQFDTFEAFFDHADRCQADPSQDDKEAVTLSTMHSAKGLEWPIVFVMGCESRMMPHERNGDLEEERRLFYVGATRTKGPLFMTWSKLRFGRNQSHSRFLEEFATGADKAEGRLHWPNRPQRKESASGEARPAKRPSAAGARAKRVETRGNVKVYRRKGGRSLIPPDERD